MSSRLRRGRDLLKWASRRWRRAAVVPIAAGLLVPLITGITSGRATVPATSVAQLRIMNYCSADGGCYKMWIDWRPDVILNDFMRIVSLNANTVRLIMPMDGYPGSPSPTIQDEFSQAISMADSVGLKVQLTLFGGFSAFNDIAGSERWAASVLSGYAGDNRLAFVEVLNEVNPSVAAQMSWSRQLIPYVRNLSGGIPVTISICGCDNAWDLGALKLGLGSAAPDFWDFHYYGGYTPGVAGVSVASALSVFLQAQQIAAPLPLIIGETGYSTLKGNSAVSGLPLTQESQEAFQYHFYKSVAKAAEQAHLPVPAPWILSDFTASGCSCSTLEQNFGLYRVDGTLKPAGAAIRDIFGAASIDTSFNNGFETSGGLCTCAGTLTSAVVPAIWRLAGVGYATFARDTAVAHSGTASAMISASTVIPGGARPSYFLSPVTSPTTGQTHTLTAWVKGTLTTGSTVIAIDEWDAAGNHSSVTSSPLRTGTTGWTQLTVSAFFPSNIVTTQLRLSSALNTGTVWFDDVTFT